MSPKLLTGHHLECLSLKGGCTGSSACTLVKMPHCCESHVARLKLARQNNLSLVVANNTGADQPAHLRSLISGFVIHFLKSIICKLATGEISNFYLVSVAEEIGLKLTLSETQMTGFVATRPNLN